jgi:hypothetical protein
MVLKLNTIQKTPVLAGLNNVQPIAQPVAVPVLSARDAAILAEVRRRQIARR